MRLALAAAAAPALATAPAAAATFDAFASFDGTQGAGGFFYGTTDDIVSGAPQFQFGCAIGDFCLTNANPVADTPLVFKSLTATTFGTVIVPDDRLVVHPGQTDDLKVIVGFLVPQTGSYRLDSLFSVQDVRPSGVGITAWYAPFGNGLSDLTLTPITVLNGGNLSFSSSEVRQLEAGDILGFVFDRQGNFMNDATGFGLTVTAVPEPGSWMLMIAGFGLVGTALRRRSVVAA